VMIYAKRQSSVDECISLCFWMTMFLTFCRCIQIRNLHKMYDTKKGSCCAVNSLQLTLYENQILALLGSHIYVLHLFANMYMPLSEETNIFFL
jgi:hypothetical protein